MKKIYVTIICVSGIFTGCRTDSSKSNASEVASSDGGRIPGTRWQATYKWGFGGTFIQLERIDDDGVLSMPRYTQQLKECAFTAPPIVKCSNDLYRVEIKTAQRLAEVNERRGTNPIKLNCVSDQMGDIQKKPYVCTEP